MKHQWGHERLSRFIYKSSPPLFLFDALNVHFLILELIFLYLDILLKYTDTYCRRRPAFGYSRRVIVCRHLW